MVVMGEVSGRVSVWRVDGARVDLCDVLLMMDKMNDVVFIL